MFAFHRVARFAVNSITLILVLVFGLMVARSVNAATLPSGFTETRLTNALVAPTAMSFAPDGRLFVAEQGGRLRIIKNGALLGTPFATLPVNSEGERGLLGVAFDPNFASNSFVYVYYTTTTVPIHNRVSRLTASAANADVVAAGSEVVILDLPALSSATNHNGGAIHFGPDGMLYIAVGDNANPSNAPLLSTTLGKMLRIQPNGTIPSNNPFVSQTTGINQAIWARGLRNPFNFAFDRVTGRLHINDVGQSTWEEVNLGIAGAHYGWPSTEGPNPAGAAGVTYPLHSYANSGVNCAIVGATFYNPPASNFPSEYTGRYFFGDFCGGFIRMLSPPSYNTSVDFATGINSLVDLQVGPDGMLYYLARGNGEVVRVQFTSGTPPSITDQPDSLTVAVGQSATFQVAASGSGPLQYQWQRNNVNIAGATSTSYTLNNASLADNGATFRAIVSNSFGSFTSNSATLTVTGNSAPVGTITAPTNSTLYRGGQVIAFSGTGSDAEDGALPASRFTWRVDLHHDSHSHPHMQPTSGITSGTFTIADRGETSANVFYRLTLTVTDSSGLTQTSFVDVRPRTSQITLTANPAGARLTLDGQPVTAPITFTGVEGVIRSIGVVTPQTINGSTYTFTNWSDGGAATHEITTPDADTTYNAALLIESVPSTTVFTEGFETHTGWAVTSGEDTARAGNWQRGLPQATTYDTYPMQLGACDGGSKCLITEPSGGGGNAGIGWYDLDAGRTSVQSPPIALPVSSLLTLNFRYYFSHLADATADDYFRVQIVSNGIAQTVFQELGTPTIDAAAWVGQSIDLTAYSGRSIRIRLEAMDAGTPSIVEAGVDNLVITRQ
jgi:glucose/arabinose dehydrogenase